jgi:uncharacterized membrane protein YhaH (DUF805 family)
MRWAGFTAYLMWAVAVMLFLSDSDIYYEYGLETSIMAVFIVVGSLLSAIGAATDRWMGEFVGLPLLATAFPVLGLLNLREIHEDTFVLATGEMFITFGISAMVSARWRVVLAVERLVRYRASMDERDHDGCRL